MKKTAYIIVYLLISLCLFSCNKSSRKEETKGTLAKIETAYGNITVVLYDETPLHRDNFLKLINDSTYKNFLFHRVVDDFMIQAGTTSPDSSATTIQSEVANTYPRYYNKRGALGAPRWDGDRNPKKESESQQFYIVTGKRFYTQGLDDLEAERTEEGFPISYTEEQRQTYSTIGGAPHLDGEYTVFGEVIEGMDVVDKIASVKVNSAHRPLKNIKLKMSIEK